jgi:hypothetical protein
MGRPRCRRVDNIKEEVGEIELGFRDWIHLPEGGDQ